MHFDLDQRTARLGVVELADFSLGPREGGSGSGGLWRAQLGSRWHREFQARMAAENSEAQFECPIEGTAVHGGWRLTLAGRIDQLVPGGGRHTLRELKTVVRDLPEDESALRADYPEYFAQLAAYAALYAAPPPFQLHPELVFVEAGSGLSQTVALGAGDDGLFRAQLGRVVEFLELRLRARDRLRGLRFAPAFAELRPGQAAAAAGLAEAVSGGREAILLDAPTGFGKTGVLLEFALGRLRSGDFERVIYLSSKSTGQLQVVQTLSAMSASVAAWQVRPKSEHCVNHAYHCVREACSFLDGAEDRWSKSGLARFYLFEGQARDLETLRAAGLNAGICPYEITRASLPFNDVWIGDYNYVFSPSSRSVFLGQPGFDPARTLLIIDEAHNLPARAADAHSRVFSGAGALEAGAAFDRVRAPSSFVLAWDAWAHFLDRLEPADKLKAEAEEEARDHLASLAQAIPSAPLDFAALGPEVSEMLWGIPAFAEDQEGGELPWLWWCPRAGELAVTCLNASAAIGATLGEFGGVVLATATPGPAVDFSDALGLRPAAAEPDKAGPGIAGDRLGSLTKRETRKLASRVTSGAALLRTGEEAARASLCHIRATTPWRDGAYRVACDVRVDTSYRMRLQSHATTSATVEALGRAGPGTAVFFSSYAYAEAIVRELSGSAPGFRVALQPRLSGLAAQAGWIEASLGSADALFLVLGSSFAESIDLLGGRIARAMVVGPALPEVNAVQKARLDARVERHVSVALSREIREAAVRQVYRIPGMQKVNQALGRLVRAPGQRAQVLLHCRRFAESDYSDLLAADFRPSERIETDADLASWLAAGASGYPEPCSNARSS